MDRDLLLDTDNGWPFLHLDRSLVGDAFFGFLPLDLCFDGDDEDVPMTMVSPFLKRDEISVDCALGFRPLLPGGFVVMAADSVVFVIVEDGVAVVASVGAESTVVTIEAMFLVRVLEVSS